MADSQESSEASNLHDRPGSRRYNLRVREPATPSTSRNQSQPSPPSPPGVRRSARKSRPVSSYDPSPVPEEPSTPRNSRPQPDTSLKRTLRSTVRAAEQSQATSTDRPPSQQDEEAGITRHMATGRQRIPRREEISLRRRGNEVDRTEAIRHITRTPRRAALAKGRARQRGESQDPPPMPRILKRLMDTERTQSVETREKRVLRSSTAERNETFDVTRDENESTGKVPEKRLAAGGSRALADTASESSSVVTSSLPTIHNISRWRKADLIVECKRRGLHVTGTKPELVQRILATVEKMGTEVNVMGGRRTEEGADGERKVRSELNAIARRRTPRRNVSREADVDNKTHRRKEDASQQLRKSASSGGQEKETSDRDVKEARDEINSAEQQGEGITTQPDKTHDTEPTEAQESMSVSVRDPNSQIEHSRRINYGSHGDGDAGPLGADETDGPERLNDIEPLDNTEELGDSEWLEGAEQVYDPEPADGVEQVDETKQGDISGRGNEAGPVDKLEHVDKDEHIDEDEQIEEDGRVDEAKRVNVAERADGDERTGVATRTGEATRMGEAERTDGVEQKYVGEKMDIVNSVLESLGDEPQTTNTRQARSEKEGKFARDRHREPGTPHSPSQEQIENAPEDEEMEVEHRDDGRIAGNDALAEDDIVMRPDDSQAADVEPEARVSALQEHEKSHQSQQSEPHDEIHESTPPRSEGAGNVETSKDMDQGIEPQKGPEPEGSVAAVGEANYPCMEALSSAKELNVSALPEERGIQNPAEPKTPFANLRDNHDVPYGASYGKVDDPELRDSQKLQADVDTAIPVTSAVRSTPVTHEELRVLDGDVQERHHVVQKGDDDAHTLAPKTVNLHLGTDGTEMEADGCLVSKKVGNEQSGSTMQAQTTNHEISLRLEEQAIEFSESPLPSPRPCDVTSAQNIKTTAAASSPGHGQDEITGDGAPMLQANERDGPRSNSIGVDVATTVDRPQEEDKEHHEADKDDAIIFLESPLPDPSNVVPVEDEDVTPAAPDGENHFAGVEEDPHIHDLRDPDDDEPSDDAGGAENIHGTPSADQRSSGEEEKVNGVESSASESGSESREPAEVGPRVEDESQESRSSGGEDRSPAVRADDISPQGSCSSAPSSPRSGSNEDGSQGPEGPSPGDNDANISNEDVAITISSDDDVPVHVEPDHAPMDIVETPPRTVPFETDGGMAPVANSEKDHADEAPEDTGDVGDTAAQVSCPDTNTKGAGNDRGVRALIRDEGKHVDHRPNEDLNGANTDSLRPTALKDSDLQVATGVNSKQNLEDATQAGQDKARSQPDASAMKPTPRSEAPTALFAAGEVEQIEKTVTDENGQVRQMTQHIVGNDEVPQFQQATHTQIGLEKKTGECSPPLVEKFPRASSVRDANQPRTSREAGDEQPAIAAPIANIVRRDVNAKRPRPSNRDQSVPVPAYVEEPQANEVSDTIRNENLWPAAEHAVLSDERPTKRRKTSQVQELQMSMPTPAKTLSNMKPSSSFHLPPLKNTNAVTSSLDFENTCDNSLSILQKLARIENEQTRKPQTSFRSASSVEKGTSFGFPVQEVQPFSFHMRSVSSRARSSSRPVPPWKPIGRMMNSRKTLDPKKLAAESLQRANDFALKTKAWTSAPSPFIGQNNRQNLKPGAANTNNLGNMAGGGSKKRKM